MPRDNLTERREYEKISSIDKTKATAVTPALDLTQENACSALEELEVDETEFRQDPNSFTDADIQKAPVDNEASNGVTVDKPLQVSTNQRLKAIEEELVDLKQFRQIGDRQLHEKLAEKTQSLKDLEEKFVKVSAELEMNVVDANAKNKVLEEALRGKQEMLQRIIAERDATCKEKSTLTLRLQVAEDQLRDVEHKLNSRVLGVEMEKACLTKTLEGVRAVAETADEISSQIQRTLCDAGVTMPQHLPSSNSPTSLIQKLIDHRDAFRSEISRREADEAKSHRMKEFLHHEIDRYAKECRRLSRELEGRQWLSTTIELENEDFPATPTRHMERADLVNKKDVSQSLEPEEKPIHSASHGQRGLTHLMDKGTQSVYLEQTDDEAKVVFWEKTEKLIASLSQRIEEIGKTRRSLEKAAGKLEAKVRSATSISTRGKSVNEMINDKSNEEISNVTCSNENNCCCAAHSEHYLFNRHSKLRSALKDALVRLKLSKNRDFITE
uniref:GRIP domain-containing protein n=1 Tax=Echinococcus granulosus TaxID=6210 RepID=A0A068WZN1_ECHGR|nr:hypothetical protein EgrG_001091100 [Echinococcus granulosus]